jgi:hypothetical protein
MGLNVQRLQTLGQQVREFSGRDQQPRVLKQSVEFGLAHATGVDEPKAKAPDAGTELPMVAGRQGGGEGATPGGGVIDFLTKTDRLHCKTEVLNDDLLVAFELGVGRQPRGIEGEYFGAIDDEAVQLGTLLPGLGLVALLLGREVFRRGTRGALGARVGKGGPPLLAFETVDLIFQELVLLAQGKHLGIELLDEVKKANDGLASRRIGNAVEIEMKIQVVHKKQAARAMAGQRAAREEREGSRSLNHKEREKGPRHGGDR